MTGELLSRNSGEWAEFYVLLDVLSVGKLYSADGNLKKQEDNYFPVISIEMQKKGLEKQPPIPIKYIVNSKDKTVKVISNNIETSVDMAEFRKEADDFFKIIKTRKKNGAFEVPEISNILEKLNNPITKQSSSRKADIHIVIHDIMTGFENEVGFSIKSKHSSPATLINASGQTLFQYRIIDNDGLTSDVMKNALSVESTDNEGKIKTNGPKKRVANLIEANFSLEFTKVKSEEFRENLQLIDSSMDVFIADCLYVFMTSSVTTLSKIVEIVADRNPCNYQVSCKQRVLDFYTYKMKRLIVDAALGMQPKVAWTGKYDASGGYIIVKEEGEVVCYHLYNWNALQDYLFNNLRFETPPSTGKKSKKSFNYALYYVSENESYIDICLQLRFI